MLNLLILALTFLLISLVAGNNLSSCTGAIISGKIVTRRSGIIIAILGYIFGLVLEGGILKNGVSALLPVNSTLFITIALFVSIIIFIYAHFKKIPNSLSFTFASVILGISSAAGLSVNFAFVTAMVLFWLLTPIVSIVLTLAMMKGSRRIIDKKNIWETINKIKVLLVVVSFFTAFTLGANTIGFVYSAIPPDNSNFLIVVVALIFGSIALSGRELNKIGNEIIPFRYLNSITSQLGSAIIVEIATLFGIPMSNTQAFTMSIYGAGLSYKNRLMIKKPAIDIVKAWSYMIIVSFIMAFALTYAFIHFSAL